MAPPQLPTRQPMMRRIATVVCVVASLGASVTYASATSAAARTYRVVASSRPRHDSAGRLNKHTRHSHRHAKRGGHHKVSPAGSVPVSTSQGSPAGSVPVSTSQGSPAGSVPVPAPQGSPAGKREVLWGAEIGPQFTGTQAPWDMNAVTDFQHTVGKAPSIVAFNIPFEQCSPSCSEYAFPVKQLSAIRTYGAIPMLNWSSMSSPLAVNEPSFRLANVTGGAFDSYIRSFALAAKAWGHPFFLRFNWEMNGNWFPWAEAANGNKPGGYVAAWRHVHDIFTSVGATNVTWVWCPTADPYHEFTNLQELYPGNSYVDWTCLDGYNFGSNKGAKGWATFEQIYSASYDQIVETIAPSKPFIIGEVGSSEEGGSKSAWISDMISKITNVYTALGAFVWFDVSQGGDDWPIESSTASTLAFTQGIASPFFTTNSFGGLGPGTIQPIA